jgi:hypothetical protein
MTTRVHPFAACISAVALFAVCHCPTVTAADNAPGASANQPAAPVTLKPRPQVVVGTAGNREQEGGAHPALLARLYADKEIWLVGETPTLKAWMDNRSDETFVVHRVQECCELVVDGRTHRWPRADPVEGQMLGPGSAFSNIRISLGADWIEMESKRPLHLEPGPHSVRIAYIARPQDADEEAALRIVSDAVAIETLPGSDEPMEQQNDRFEQQMELSRKATDRNEQIEHQTSGDRAS